MDYRQNGNVNAKLTTFLYLPPQIDTSSYIINVFHFLFCFPCLDNHDIYICMKVTIKNFGYNVLVVDKILDLLSTSHLNQS